MAEDPDWRQILELSVALEITKSERASLKDQVALLQKQLREATQRAERAEERLHDTTVMMATISREAIIAPVRSMATEVTINGRSVLRLSNPISFIEHEAIRARRHQ